MNNRADRLLLFVAACASAILLSACGYTVLRPGAALPDSVRSVYVAQVVDDEGDPVLADKLRRELRVRFRRQGRLGVVDSPLRADSIIELTVSGYRSQPVAFNQFDEVLDYDTTLRVGVLMKNRAGDTLMERDLSVSRGHPAVRDAIVASSAAFVADRKLAAGDLAEFDGVQLGVYTRAAAVDGLVEDLVDAVMSSLSIVYPLDAVGTVRAKVSRGETRP
jgi:hypothetical protein